MTSASHLPPGRPVLVGVVPGQSPLVLTEAADLAGSLDVGLVCVWVDGSRIFLGEAPDGTVYTTPLDPDQEDDSRQVAEQEMRAHLEEVLAGTGVPWVFVYTLGEVTHGLTGAAREYDARLIAVGPRSAGLTGWMGELIGGSVAGRLAHTQERPVLVVPPRSRHAG
ncbi:universal stress protein [Ornithinimicrobium sediminis]|uniref:universal stress protein n=1 Tax=Ornithinimicrobium sediminis TaxID=2904603 RepID=UPI001E49EFAA|nr:universal stress protein [Ornithinimicrobium sediminis]MCE0487857.1 universal stress protein [Ornithinimicrobium sediminis]